MIDSDPDNRGDVCDVCGSIPQVQQERYTEFQCGSSQSRDGHWHRKVACSVIARLRERVAEANDWIERHISSDEPPSEWDEGYQHACYHLRGILDETKEPE